MTSRYHDTVGDWLLSDGIGERERKRVEQCGIIVHYRLVSKYLLDQDLYCPVRNYRCRVRFGESNDNGRGVDRFGVRRDNAIIFICVCSERVCTEIVPLRIIAREIALVEAESSCYNGVLRAPETMLRIKCQKIKVSIGICYNARISIIVRIAIRTRCWYRYRYRYREKEGNE